MRNVMYERFSTKDKDNENFANVSCAKRDHGGWWYYHNTYCSFANLNGPYLAGTVKKTAQPCTGRIGHKNITLSGSLQ